MQRPAISIRRTLFILGTLGSAAICAATVIGVAGLSGISGTGCATAGGETSADDAGPDLDAIMPPDAGPFDPSQLTGLVLWLSANQGVTMGANASVTAWADQSGKKNNAAPGTTLPIFIDQIANGQPAVRFDGAATYMQLADGPSFQFATGDFTVEVVDAVRGSGIASLFGKTVQTTPFTGPVLFANFSSTKLGAQVDSNHTATGTTTGLNDGNFHLFGMRRDSGTLEVRVNGLAEGNDPGTGTIDVSATGSAPTIGGQAKLVQMLNGDIAEVIIVKGTLSDADLKSLETYLKSKYSLH